MSAISSLSSHLTSVLSSSTPAKSAKRDADATALERGEDTVKLSLAGVRQILQEGRIQLNVEAGRLTGDEADAIRSQYQAIRDQIATDKETGDGALSEEQAKAINQMQTELSHSLYAMAHNDPSE